MAIVNGTSTEKDKKRPRKQGVNVQVPTAGPIDKPIETPTLDLGLPMDPSLRRRGGAGLAGPKGAPTSLLEVQTLKEGVDMINAEAKTESETARAIPTAGPILEQVEPVKQVEEPQLEEEIPFTERITGVDTEADKRIALIAAEPARQNKQLEIDAINKQRELEIKDIKEEEKLFGDELVGEIEAERRTGIRDIAKNEGLPLGVAAQTFDKRVTARATMNAQQTAAFDATISQITQEGFDANSAYDVAITEYEKDGIDSDDMTNANKAIASVFGQNFADQQEDEFLIETRQVPRDIVENNRALTSAKRLGDTVNAGKAGARVTNAYLAQVMDADPSLIPDAISKILASDATDDAKRQASAFARDFFTGVETGIGAGFLTEAAFKAGAGTPQQRQEFEQGFRALEAIKADTKAGQPDFEQSKFEFQVSKEFEDQSQEFLDVQNAFQRINVSADAETAAGDLALIFNFMKMLDPNSVVRESEFRSAEQAKAWLARTEDNFFVPTFVKTMIQKASPEEKGAFLLPQQRQDFRDRAGDLFNEQLGNQERRQTQFGEQLGKFGGRGDILRDLIDPQFKDRGVTDTQPIEFTGIDRISAEEFLRANNAQVTDANIEFLLGQNKTEQQKFERIEPDETFNTSVGDVSTRLGMDADGLRRAMNIETVGTLNPAIQNPRGSASGMIQFTASTAEALGTTIEEVRNMTRGGQIDLAGQYFELKAREHGFKTSDLNNVEEVYMAIAAPAGVGKPDATILFKKDSRAWNDNDVWRPSDGGDITVGSIKEFVRNSQFNK